MYERRQLTRKYSRRGYLLNKLSTLGAEITTRLLLLLIFWCFEGEKAVPCVRNILAEELWLYKYPRRDSYVPTWMMWTEVFTVGPILLTIVFLYTKDKRQLHTDLMSYSLACLLNGAIVNIIKVCAGRPRPDFFYRCFPDKDINEFQWSDDIHCTGANADVVEGRKSFPSGHSSWSFTVMTWAFLYISGRLQTFSHNGDSKGWKLSLSILPLVFASCIAISRTCDNHHHWQDVLVGSLLGILVSITVYGRYYPSLQHRHSNSSLEALSSEPHAPLLSTVRHDNPEDVKVV